MGRIGFDWPSLESSKASHLLALQYQLERSSVMPAKDFEQMQLKKALQVARQAAVNCSYYQRQMPIAILDRDCPVTAEVWRTIPLLSRRELQRNNESVISRDVASSDAKVSRVFTSGSTGTPVMVLSTPATRSMWQALALREHLWHRRDHLGTLVVIRSTSPGYADPPGRSQASWGPPVGSVANTGPSHILNIHSSIEEQADFLNRANPHYLLTYPSVLRELGILVRKGALALPRLQQLRTFGELLEPSARSAIENDFGVSIADVYSSHEVGYIAIQCPVSGLYHLQGESLLVEVLDEQGNACAEGEIGRVVLTSLVNDATPLIRYEIGDYAEIGPPCICGRSLPTLRRVIGRQRNLLQLPDGRKIWPMPLADSNPEVVLAQLPPIVQFQIAQIALATVEARLVAPRELTESEIVMVRSHVQTMLGFPFDVIVRRVDAIPRGAGGKFEDFRSEIDLEVAR